MYDSRSQQKHVMLGRTTPKPTLTKPQALHEAWFDLMDVRDEQAIADDGIVANPHVSTYFDVPGEYAPLVPHALVSTESDGYRVPLAMRVAARLERKAIAKAKRNGVVMVNHDVDPYTGEPYAGDTRPSGFVRVSTRRK